MSNITINGITVDPLAQSRALSTANLEAPDAADSDYILIQTKQPLNKAQKDELAAKGAVILEYVPDDTYLCQYKETSLDGIRALPYVDWANVYLRAFKIAPALADMPPEPRVRNLMEMAVRPERTLSRTPKTVDVVLHEDVDPNQVRDKLAAAARIDPADLQAGGHKARVTVQSRYLSDLAALDEVRHIEEVYPYKLHNDIARKILNIDQPNPGATLFEGEGQLVVVADTGFDKGSTTDVHPAFTGRVAKLYALGRPNRASDPDGHGTHVAGSVLGDGQSDMLGVRVRGTAPKARLILQSVLDSNNELGGLPADLHNLFQPPYANDQARIHTNSWGSKVADGRYDQNASELDDFVWNHRDLVVCFSAGNAGADRNGDGQVDAQSISPPGTAKNCITVGASENDRPDKTLSYGEGWPSSFPAIPLSSDPVANDPEGIVAFSSRGPTRDQRIKPDVVAPGTYILSTRSRITTSEGWELSDDKLYMFDGGTSMATPLVAGCVALIREYLAKQHGKTNPSAALVKALLINGAHDVAGQYQHSEAGISPNFAEGFGRVDMQATIGTLPAGAKLILNDEDAALDTGDEKKTMVTVDPGARVLKATLVWTDPAGESLQNDLDLIVKASNGRERHGNMPASSKKFDRSNNVEQVTWKSVPAGPVEIIVRAHRIARFAQSFALVVRIE
jgi:serine protease AprX